MGSYVFLWGQKQERTPTWYGMFLENGDETASIDVMHYLWNGSWPQNQTPVLDSLLMNDKNAYASISVDSGQPCSAKVFVSDMEGDELSYSWEVIPEVPEGEESDGGDMEGRQKSVNIDFNSSSPSELTFIGPKEEGEYRLFVYVSDGNGHSATANIPFLVRH
jgi:hypothetical protein